MFDHIGTVRYRSKDAEALAGFYHDVLGFAVRSQTANHWVLGTPQRDLLVIEGDPAARRYEKTTGLYHTAFLVPAHRDLAQLLRRIIESKSPIEGFNHHGTHEAVYLPDTDGNGIELAWDLPEDQWPRGTNGQIDFMRHDKTFDPQAVYEEATRDTVPWDKLPDGAYVGHVHLHMADLAASRKFYHEGLGMDVVLEMERQGMLFLSYDGYHHHVGNNLWKGRGLPPPPSNAVGLIDYELRLDAQRWETTEETLKPLGFSAVREGTVLRTTDPAGLGVVLTKI